MDLVGGQGAHLDGRVLEVCIEVTTIQFLARPVDRKEEQWRRPRDDDWLEA